MTQYSLAQNEKLKNIYIFLKKRTNEEHCRIKTAQVTANISVHSQQIRLKSKFHFLIALKVDDRTVCMCDGSVCVCILLMRTLVNANINAIYLLLVECSLLNVQ